MDPYDFQCSIIHDALDTAPRPIGFRDALSGIRTGRWSALVQAVRVAYHDGGKDAASAPKKKLPGILFSGTFSRRASSALTRPSGLICADLDALGDTSETWFEQITADPHTLACFRSPTGSGLKVVFRCDPAKPHKESYHALEHYMLEHFGLQIDEKCSDVSRICFVSHDPELFAAEDAEVIPYPPPAPPTVKEFVLPAKHGSDLSPGDDFNLRGADAVPEILAAFGWTHLRGIYWCRPGKAGEVSASWGHIPNTLIVFSSAPETGFPSDRKGFDPFAIYTHLQCSGDFRNAAQQLARRGYGTPARRPQAPVAEMEPGPDDEYPPEAPPAQQLPGEKFLRDVPAKTPKPTLDSRRVRFAAKPQEPVTRLFLNNKPVCTPANLTTIISRAKTGKTTALGAAVAAIIGAHHDRHDLDTFKFTAPHTDEAVILIDTEQSPYDAWTCHQRTLQRSGGEQDPEWLHHYALVGMGAKQLRDSLSEIITKATIAHKGIFTIILDGVADFVTSVNDEAETNEFVAWLQSLAVAHNTPIICVIHSNEGVKNGDDGRGHLGKQLTRKAESNLLLKKTGEITTITSEKQRKAPITDKDGVAFTWSDEYQRHISCDPEELPAKKKGGKPKLFVLENFMDIFPRSTGTAAPQRAIWNKARELTGITESTFRDLLADSYKQGAVSRIEKGGVAHYYLTVPPATA